MAQVYRQTVTASLRKRLFARGHRRHCHQTTTRPSRHDHYAAKSLLVCAINWSSFTAISCLLHSSNVCGAFSMASNMRSTLSSAAHRGTGGGYEALMTAYLTLWTTGTKPAHGRRRYFCKKSRRSDIPGPDRGLKSFALNSSITQFSFARIFQHDARSAQPGGSL